MTKLLVVEEANTIDERTIITIEFSAVLYEQMGNNLFFNCSHLDASEAINNFAQSQREPKKDNQWEIESKCF